MNKNKIKVLQVIVGDGVFSGVTSFLYNYYLFLDGNVLFDFYFCRKNSFGLKSEDKVLSDSKIYDPQFLKKKNGFREYIKLFFGIRQILKEEDYDLVHINTGNIYIQCCVALATRGHSSIAHSHSALPIDNDDSIGKKIIKKLTRKLAQSIIVNKSVFLLACSKQAGDYLFGKNCDVVYVKNAIDVDKFKFNSEIRAKKRHELGLNDSDLVIGNIGRFMHVKNQEFLVHVCFELNKIVDNYKLIFVGDGDTFFPIKSLVNQLGIQDKVLFLGERNDVHELYQAFDLLVLPSLSEGLPFASIEAQASGLPVLLSSGVSSEAKIASNLKYKKLSDGAVSWAHEIINIIELNKLYDRSSGYMSVINAGFDIKTNCDKLLDIYRKTLNN